MSAASQASPRRTGGAVLAELAGKTGLPFGIHLQVSDRCNHACGHCYQVQGQKGELELGQIKALLEDLARAGVLLLSISGGEATLRSDLIEILHHARDLGFATRLFTNAFGLSAALIDGIASAKVLEVHVSVYSDRPHEHDAVTRVQGSLESTLESIRKLRARGVRVKMKTPLLKLAPGARTRVEALAKTLGCDFQASATLTPAEDGSLEPLALSLSPEELLAQGMLQPWAPGAEAENAADRARKLGSAACGVCTNSVAIMPNGEVRPCTDTIVPLGNLTRERLTDLFARSPEVSLFRTLTWNDVHGCRDCDLLLACSRCHASAAQEQGDYLGPYERACARARVRYAAAAGEVTMLPPAPGCAPGRTDKLGPYRIEAPATLRPIEDREAAEDRARTQKYPWIRPQAGYFAAASRKPPVEKKLSPRRLPVFASAQPGEEAGPRCGKT